MITVINGVIYVVLSYYYILKTVPIYKGRVGDYIPARQLSLITALDKNYLLQDNNYLFSYIFI